MAPGWIVLASLLLGASIALEWKPLDSNLELHKHDFVLCLLSVPWCGESRSFMGQFLDEISGREDKFPELELRLVDVRKHQQLKEDLASHSGRGVPYLTLFRFGKPYSYSGGLMPDHVLAFLERTMATDPPDVPIRVLESAEQVQEFVDSTDRAFLLVDLCGWSRRPQDELVEASQDGFGWSHLLETEEQEGSGFISQEALKNFSTPEELCSTGDKLSFDAFYRNLTLMASRTFLRPEHSRFAKTFSLEPLERTGIQIAVHKRWAVISRCQDQLRSWNLLGEANQVEAFVANCSVLVDEVDTNSKYLDSRPAVLLFINRGSYIHSIRDESRKALEALRETARHYTALHPQGRKPEKAESAAENVSMDSSLLPTLTTILSANVNKATTFSIRLQDQEGFGTEIEKLLSGGAESILQLLLGARDVAESVGQNEAAAPKKEAEVKEKEEAEVKGKEEAEVKEKVEAEVTAAKEAQVAAPRDEAEVTAQKEEAEAAALKETVELGAPKEETEEAGLKGEAFGIQQESAESRNANDDTDGESEDMSEEQGHNLESSTNEAGEEQKTDSIFFGFLEGVKSLEEYLTGREASVRPTLAVLVPKREAYYLYPEDLPFDVSSLIDFLDQAVSGSLQPTVRSEPDPRPPPRDAPRPPFVNLDFHEMDGVPRVTLATFSKLVLGSENDAEAETAWRRDTLVLFTLPWCGFCKKMELVVREVHRYFKYYFQPKNSIDKMTTSGKTFGYTSPTFFQIDCSRNDCGELLGNVTREDGYPVVALFPARNKHAVEVYRGAPTVHGVFEFLAAHGTCSAFRRMFGGVTPQETSAATPIFIDAALVADARSPTKRTTLVQIAPGYFLVATDKLTGSQTFDKAAILIVSTRADYVMGLIVNRPVQWEELPSLSSDLKLTKAAFISNGGPVFEDPEHIYTLTKQPDVEGLVELYEGLFVGGPATTQKVFELIEGNKVPPSRFMFAAGHCGWTLDQLQQELAAGYWDITQYRPGLLNLADDGPA